MFAALVACVLTWPVVGRAGEVHEHGHQAPAAAAPQLVPDQAEGCMPDGGCCGACQAYRELEQAKQRAEGTTDAAHEAGGCPCKRLKQKQEM